MQPQPAQQDRALQRRAVLIRRAASLEERAVDQLDIDAAVMDRLDRVGDLDQLAGGDVGISEAARWRTSQQRILKRQNQFRTGVADIADFVVDAPVFQPFVGAGPE